MKDEVGADLKPLGEASHFIPIIFLSLRFIQSASVLASAGACCRGAGCYRCAAPRLHIAASRARFSKTPLATPLPLWQVASGDICAPSVRTTLSARKGARPRGALRF